jgi:hypothetical protein
MMGRLELWRETSTVTPAEAGVQGERSVKPPLDSRFRGNDGMCR